MALQFNGSMYRSVGVRHFGAGVVNSTIPVALQSNFAHTNRLRNLTAGEGIPSELVGLPSGYRHPGAWMMPQKAGAIAARNTVTGLGALSGAAQSGYNIAGTLTGDGGIPSSVSIGLIVSIAAALTASGGISSAATQALASLVASVTGAGSVTATAAGLATLGAALSGSSFVTANNTALMAISATIKGYSDLTPEGIRDNVWNAIAANFNTAGTMGNKLNSAASGGVDYAALGQAVWAVLAGDADTPGTMGAYVQTAGAPAPTAPENAAAVRSELAAELLRVIEIAKIHGLVQGTDLVVTPTSRVAGGVVQTITGDGINTSTVSRT